MMDIEKIANRVAKSVVAASAEKLFEVVAPIARYWWDDRLYKGRALDAWDTAKSMNLPVFKNAVTFDDTEKESANLYNDLIEDIVRREAPCFRRVRHKGGFAFKCKDCGDEPIMGGETRGFFDWYSDADDVKDEVKFHQDSCGQSGFDLLMNPMFASRRGSKGDNDGQKRCSC